MKTLRLEIKCDTLVESVIPHLWAKLPLQLLRNVSRQPIIVLNLANLNLERSASTSKLQTEMYKAASMALSDFGVKPEKTVTFPKDQSMFLSPLLAEWSK